MIITGKKTSSAATIILETGFVIPNQALKIGAMAMIGMALAATAKGRTASRAVAQRATMKATTTPATVPMSRPPTASNSVAWAAAKSGQRPAPQFSTRAAPIAEGGGRMNVRMARARVKSSQPTSTVMATTTAGA